MKTENIIGILLVGILITTIFVFVQILPRSTPPNMQETLNVYGILLDYQSKSENTVLLSIQQWTQNYEINPGVVQIEAETNYLPLKKGENYSFNFNKYTLENTWKLYWVDNEFDWDAAYDHHEGDLTIRFVYDWENVTGPLGAAIRITTPIVKENEHSTFYVKIVCNQDQPIEYTFSGQVLVDNECQGIVATVGSPSTSCVATGLNKSGAIEENTTELLPITIVCDNVINDLRENITDYVSGDLRYDETFGKFFITANLTFTDEFGKVHQKETGNPFPFAVRPKEIITPPDNKEYTYYEDLPIGSYDWRNNVYYFFGEGYTLDKTEVTWTEVGDSEIVLWVDNPMATSRTPKIVFEDNMPETHRRIQLYGVLDYGIFRALKWSYIG